MAADRRVEARPGLAGTGMASDVDRVRDVEDEYERKARAWREAPEKGFGAVLEEAPAQAELADEEGPDPRRRPKRPPAAPAEAALAAEQLKAAEEPPPKDGGTAKPQGPARAGPRLPPDPRAALLHKKVLEKKDALPVPPRISSPGATSTETPPTGNPGTRRRP